jgi:hypothetical protein
LIVGCALSAPLALSAGHDGAPKPARPAAYIGPRIPSILLPTLVAPVVVDGELHHYVFLGITLELTAPAHKKRMLEKIPYLQDAFLREVHRASIAKDNDPALLDEVGLKQRLTRASAAVVGDGVVQTVQLTAIVQTVH